MRRIVLTVISLLGVTFPCISSAQWSTVSSANLARFEVATAVHDGKLVLFNGFSRGLTINNTVEQYDPDEDEWTVLGSTEVGLGNAVTHAGNVKVNNEIWLIGGRIGNHPGAVSDQVWIYNLDTNSWREGPGLPRPFAGGGAGLVDGKIYLFGGMDPQGQCDTDHHYVYDLNNPKGWQEITSVAAMPMPRNHFSTAVIGEKIYAIGGWLNHGRCGNLPFGVEVNTVHSFDPATFQWERVADLPFVRSHAEPGTFTYNNLIYVVGGRVHGSEIVTYNPATDEWVVREEFELPVTLMATSARIIDGKFIVATGGETFPTNSSTTTRVFDLPSEFLETEVDIVFPTVAEITGIPDPITPQIWSDSYGVDGQCYCEDGLDHDIGDVEYETPIGLQTVSAICATIEEQLGTGRETGRIYYNTVQCGRGPISVQASDELFCPGIPRAHRDFVGPRCDEVGPSWRLDLLYPTDAGASASDAGQDSASIPDTADDSQSSPLDTSIGNPFAAINEDIIYRVNAGGPTLVSEGGTWISNTSASEYYNTGRPWSNGDTINLGAVDQSIPSALFNTELFDPAGGPELSWEFPVTPGRYRVNLYFAEIWSGAQSDGARVFDVSVEDETLTNVDVYSMVGSNTALVKTLEVDSDDMLNIDFERINNNPAIKGIEIIRVASADASSNNDTTVQIPDSSEDLETSDVVVESETELDTEEESDVFVPEVEDSIDAQIAETQNDQPVGPNAPKVIYRVNAGGARIDSSETSWISNTESKQFNDQGKTWSSNASINTDQLSTTVPEEIFQTERWYVENTQWDFPVTPGQYQVTVYLAENWSGAMSPGFREFNLQVEDLIEAGVDVFNEVGANTALEKQFLVNADDEINIRIEKVSHNPSIKGIEIVDLGYTEPESISSSVEADASAEINAPVETDAQLQIQRIEAENYTTQSGILTLANTDVEGGLNVGFINNGDSTDYVLDVPSSGTYDFAFRVASQLSGGALTLTRGGTVIASVNVPGTGGWQNWITVETTAVLTEGTSEYRFEYSGTGRYLFNIDWFEFSEGATSP